MRTGNYKHSRHPLLQLSLVHRSSLATLHASHFPSNLQEVVYNEPTIIVMPSSSKIINPRLWVMMWGSVVCSNPVRLFSSNDCLLACTHHFWLTAPITKHTNCRIGKGRRNTMLSSILIIFAARWARSFTSCHNACALTGSESLVLVWARSGSP